jgi:dienelactone hydrolase
MTCASKTVASSFRLMSRILAWATLMNQVASAAESAPAATRRFESRDSVEMASFTSGTSLSPDGSTFVITTERGVLPGGVTDATLWAFDTVKVRRAVAEGPSVTPMPLARMSGAINGDLLTNVQWESDSAGVLFLGRQGEENRGLFRVRLGGHTVERLSPPGHDVVDYSIAAKRIVYFAGVDAADPSAADVVAGAGQPLIRLLYPNYERGHRTMPSYFEVWTIEGGIAAPVDDVDTGKPMRAIGSYNVSAMTASHDGTRIVAIVHADEIPESWGEYVFPREPDTRAFDPHTRTSDPQADYGRALQYQVIDIGQGKRYPLLGAPLADYQRGGPDTLQAVWSPDDRYVAVSGSYLPLAEPAGEGPLKTCGAAIVDARAGTLACVVDRNQVDAGPVTALHWRTSGTLAVQSDASEPLVFQYRGGRWNQADSAIEASRTTPPLELSIRQSLNEPPVLVAKDPASGQERKIFDPNPQVAAIDLGTVIPYEWTDQHGRTIVGGLVKPSDFMPGKRYPVVIQTHGFRPRRFFNSGTADTATAGRALAGRGILVLQVDEPDDAYMLTWQEATENGTRVYLAAIDKLVAEGLADSDKVGITGYSRMGFYVAKAITDAPERFAAAVVVNADPGSLTGYYSYIDYVLPTYAQGASSLFAGGPPYGDSLRHWIERAPGFRTDRIQAPVLISAADPQHLISLWGLYAPLRDQGKPVELQYIRSGQHNITKPLQKLAHQEMLTDWFDFWLNDHEDADEGKRTQYARWRQLREARPAKRNP